MNITEYLDWAETVPVRSAYNDALKLEHIILASFGQQTHAAVQNLVFQQYDAYNVLAHYWLPDSYPQYTWDQNALGQYKCPLFEEQLAISIQDNSAMPVYPTFIGYNDDAAILVDHSIFFNTDFGRQPITDSSLQGQDVIDLITNAIAGTSDIDAIGEHLSALAILGATVPAPAVQAVRSWRDTATPQMSTYHAHLVSHLMDAILTEKGITV